MTLYRWRANQNKPISDWTVHQITRHFFQVFGNLFLILDSIKWRFIKVLFRLSCTESGRRVDTLFIQLAYEQTTISPGLSTGNRQIQCSKIQNSASRCHFEFAFGWDKGRSQGENFLVKNILGPGSGTRPIQGCRTKDLYDPGGLWCCLGSCSEGW